MNKKGAVPVVVWVVLAIAALFIANEVGFFSVMDPTDVGDIPSVLQSPYVNKWYYGNIADEGATWECSTNNIVKFRTTDLTYSTTSEIGYSSTAGNNLKAYSYTTKYQTIYNNPCSTAVPNRVATCGTATLLSQIPGGWLTGYDYTELYSCSGISDKLFVCNHFPGGLSEQKAEVRAYTENVNALISTSPVSLDSSKEVLYGIYPVKDAGKYTCKNGDVVLKYCVYNGAEQWASVLQDDCNSLLQCNKEIKTIEGVLTPVMKCAGDYKPLLSVCSSDTSSLHTTNNLGSLTTTLCGIQPTYHFCYSSDCIDCYGSASWCGSDGKSVYTCSNKQVLGPTTCTGTGVYCLESKTGTAAYETTARCTTDINVGTLRCLGAQPQIYTKISDTYYEYQNYGPSCLTSCNAGKCVNETKGDNVCDTSGETYCDSVSTELFKCNIRTDGTGNYWSYYSATQPTCLTGGCASETKCLSYYTLGYEYCSKTFPNQREIAVSDTNLLTGGVKLQNVTISGLSVAPCNSFCEVSGIPQKSKCHVIEGCTGISPNLACIDQTVLGTFTKLIQCNEVGDKYVSSTTCNAQNIYSICDPQTLSCFTPPPQCSGTYGCANDGLIYECDQYGYFNTSKIVEDCNGKGCYTLGAPASPTNSQCFDYCNGSSAYACEAGFYSECVLTTSGIIDMDFKQYLLSADKKRCDSGECSAEDSLECAPLYAPGSYYCKSDGLYYAEVNSLNFSSGFIKETFVDGPCPAGCGTSPNNYCDNAKLSMQDTQSGTSKEAIYLTGTLFGDESLKGLSGIDVYAKLDGESQSYSGTADESGIFSIDIGQRVLGTYNATITVPSYNIEKKIKLVVTNSYTIKFPELIAQIIPGGNTTLKFTCADATGGRPDTVIVTTNPSNLTVTAVKDPVENYWNLNILNPQPGIYKVGLSPREGGISLNEWTQDIELVQPAITVSTNMPSSVKLGSQTFDIYVSGPQSDGVSGLMKADSIIVKINGETVSNTEDVSKAGTYTFTYNFVTAGTYTLDVDVTKAGYRYDKPTNGVPFATYASTSGNKEVPSGTIGGSSSSGTSGTSGGTGVGKDYSMFIIVSIIVVVGLILFRKKIKKFLK